MALSSDSPEHTSDNTTSSSNISYLSYPVKYAVTSALRRLSSDPASTFGLSSQRFSRKANSRKTSPERSSSAHPDPIDTATRNPQPFQPPPLSPLALMGFSSSAPRSTHVLTSQLAEEIRLLVPARLQLSDEWKLAFSLERDGSSLSTLFDKAEAARGRRVGYVLVVKDASPNGGTFGAYLSDPPRPSNGHYYGTGECFLWRASVLSSQVPISALSLPPRPSEDTSHYESRDVTIGSPTKLRRSSHAFSPTSPTGRSKRDSTKAKKNGNDDLISFDSDNDDNNNEPETPNTQNGDNVEDTFGDFHSGNTPAAESAPHFDFPESSTRIDSPPPSHTSNNNNNHSTALHNHHLDSAHDSDTASGAQTPHRIRFKAFPYSGLNDYMIFCEHSFLSVGGGDGHYGLFLDGSLEKGLTAKCPTFGNEVLSEEGGKFEVLGVELWVIGV